MLEIEKNIIHLLKSSLLVEKNLKNRVLYWILENRLNDTELSQILIFLKKEDTRLKEYLEYTTKYLAYENLTNIKWRMIQRHLKHINDLEQDSADFQDLEFNF
ncbi:MAG: hypothetical protein ACD_3C00001G0001 [uncultured bacterium (gcode 4)]|uniref:Uncharacterized protein n=1 Tax=uncultured bacterium (gcode 4) TaxID=1234023 RepID=K2GZC6_9BACT|nr:MAG: hypothetical protein ACD_3C00001G0001 [uncultured bacterium (gcode 4)]